MPELLALIACERVIIDTLGNATLVIQMEKVEAEFPEGTELQQNIVTPKEWAIFTIWKLKDGERPGQNYRHVTEVVAPWPDSQKPRIVADLNFKDQLHKVVHGMQGFPIGVSGILYANVWLEQPQGTRVTEVYSYPIQVKHKFVKVDSPVTATPQ